MRLPFVAFLAALFVFLSHAAPGLTFEDSGELAAAAASFGVPHPPGFPLLTLVGGLWIRALEPFGVEPARAMVLLSVLSAALTVALIVRFVGGRDSRHPIAALLAGGMLLFSPTFGAQAVVVEAYAPAAALTAALFHAATRARPLGLGLLFGLAIAAHPASVFLFPLFVFGVLRTGALSKVWPKAAGGLALGLAVFLYVPLAAARAPALNWGGIDGLGSLFDHLLRRQFAGGPPRDLAAQAAFLAEHLLGQWPLLIAVALIFGGAFTRRKRATEPVAEDGTGGELVAPDVRLPLIASSLLVTALGLFWAQHWPVSDELARVRLAGSFTPLVVLSAAAIGLLLTRVETRLDTRFGVRHRIPTLVLGLLLAGVHVAPSYGGAGDGRPTLDAFTNMSDVTEAEAFARATLTAAPPGCILVVNRLGYSDVLYFPLIYGQVVLGLGPEVLVVDRELLGADWYRRQLETARPELGPALGRLAQAYAGLPEEADPRARRIANVPFLRELAARPEGLAFLGRPSARIADGLALDAVDGFWWLGRTPRVATSSKAPLWPFLSRKADAYADPWRQELVRLAKEYDKAGIGY